MENFLIQSSVKFAIFVITPKTGFRIKFCDTSAKPELIVLFCDIINNLHVDFGIFSVYKLIHIRGKMNMLRNVLAACLSKTRI